MNKKEELALLKLKHENIKNGYMDNLTKSNVLKKIEVEIDWLNKEVREMK